jgi:hypothetical protein
LVLGPEQLWLLGLEQAPVLVELALGLDYQWYALVVQGLDSEAMG